MGVGSGAERERPGVHCREHISAECVAPGFFASASRKSGAEAATEFGVPTEKESTEGSEGEVKEGGASLDEWEAAWSKETSEEGALERARPSSSRRRRFSDSRAELSCWRRLFSMRSVSISSCLRMRLMWAAWRLRWTRSYLRCAFSSSVFARLRGGRFVVGLGKTCPQDLRFFLEGCASEEGAAQSPAEEPCDEGVRYSDAASGLTMSLGQMNGAGGDDDALNEAMMCVGVNVGKKLGEAGGE